MKAYITGTGGWNSLGHHIAVALHHAGYDVHGLTMGRTIDRPKSYHEFDFDVTSPRDLRQLTDWMSEEENLQVLVNCAGIASQEWFENLSESSFNKLMAVNATSILNVSQACLPALTRNQGVILNVISQAANIPMTASLAYNASKAAAQMMTRQMARELTPRYGVTVLGVSPSKLAGTAMSQQVYEDTSKVRGWSAQEAEARQRSVLLSGEEIPPETVAAFIGFLLKDKESHHHLSGCILDYGV